MSYKIVRVTNFYPEWLKSYYESHPRIGDQSYSEQYDHLIANSVDAASTFTRRLQELGVDAHDIFSNARALQARWQAERNLKLEGKDLIFEQIKELSPHVVWLDDMRMIDSKWLTALRRDVPSIKIIAGYCCAPYTSDNLRNFRSLDFLITCTPCFKTDFESKGLKAYLVYHAFEANLAEIVSRNNTFPETDVFFSGSLFTGGGFHKTRIDYIEGFIRNGLPLNIYGYVDSTWRVVKKKAVYRIVNGFRSIGAGKLVKHTPFLKNLESFGDTPVNFYSRKLRASIRKPVFGIDQLKLLSKAKISFNIHVDIARGCAGNMRLFEATGTGSCLITDWKQNIEELFVPGKEIVVYRSPEECAEKIKWLLDNPLERAQIARAGQVRTLKDHTVERRARQVHEIMIRELSSRA